MLVNIEYEIKQTEKETINLTTGIYKHYYLDFDNEIKNSINRNPIFEGKKAYGLCDNYQQVLNNFKEIESNDTKYFILLKEIKKSDLKKEKEYKYSSWGGYYGDFNIKEKFFSLEKGLDIITAFHIMESHS